MTILTDKQRNQVLANDSELSSIVLRYWDLNDVREFVQAFSQTGNTSVTTLGFYDSMLTDDLLQVIAGLKETAISKLSLSDIDSSIADRGVIYLTALNRLQDLTIAGSLTSKCLSELFDNLPHLRILEIYSPALTEGDVEPFLAKYPSVAIYLNGSDALVSVPVVSPQTSKISPTLFSQSILPSSPDTHSDKYNMLEAIFESFLEAQSNDHRRALIEALVQRIDMNTLNSFFRSVKAIGPTSSLPPPR